ncbi:DUF3617 domain-containing protein [Uliginosibacterium gangwonense]|uniref:DUF3617 domain-containing protein n=1 Tax=Uliginosibacterium gangwonense TaxID=392736 RepID=UPI00036304BA|nr:DUF3617 family protein [Uliginosibacterium gangwonense]
MKQSMLFCLLATACNLAWAQTTDLPKRKAGMWEVKIESASTSATGLSSLQCIDDATDATLQKQVLTGGGQSGCKLTSSQKTATGWEFDSVCKTGNTTLNTHSVVSGDMQSSYQITVTTKATPPINGQSTLQTTIKSSYAGACKAGMKPGDINVNGMTMNMLSGNQNSNATISQEQAKKMLEQLQKSLQ